VRSLPDPGFAGDDGAADPSLVAALAAYDAQPESRELWLRALAVLQDARLLVPVVALAEEGGTDMAAVLMQGRSGRTALLAFTGQESMTAWDPQARPVPVTAPDAAKAAVQNGAGALLLDVAGPVLFPVEGQDLGSLGAGHRLVQVAGSGWGWVRVGPDG
jgi:hypothetical protein